MAAADGFLELDLDDLTIGEIITIEEMTGVSLDELGAAGRPKGLMLRAIGFVLMRRGDPNVTVEQVDGMKLRFDTSKGAEPGPLGVAAGGM